MKTCQTCNLSFPDDKAFCKYCGKALSEDQIDEPPSTQVTEHLESQSEQPPLDCPGCGNAIQSPNAKFCFSCGTSLDASQPQNERAANTRSKALREPAARNAFWGGLGKNLSTLKEKLSNSVDLSDLPPWTIPSLLVVLAFGIFSAAYLLRSAPDEPTSKIHAATALQNTSIKESEGLESPQTESRLQASSTAEQPSPEPLPKQSLPESPSATATRQMASSKLQPSLNKAVSVSAAETQGKTSSEPLSAQNFVGESSAPRAPAPVEISEGVEELGSEGSEPLSGEEDQTDDVARAPINNPLVLPASVAAPVTETTTDSPSRPPSLRRQDDVEPDRNYRPARRQATGPIRNQIFEVKTRSYLSASGSKKGDPFEVEVLSPDHFRGSTIRAEVSKAKASGKVKGKSELNFSFEELVLSDGRTIPITAELKGVRNSRGVAEIDEEGHVIGKSSKKKDLAKTALLSGLGALVGGLAGGKSGAAKGAAIGAAVGLTIVFTTRGEDIKFAPGSVFTLSVSQEDTRQSRR